MGITCWYYSLEIYLGECFHLHCVYSSELQRWSHNIRDHMKCTNDIWAINVVMLEYIKSNMVCVRRQYVVPKNMNPQYIINVVISIDALGTWDWDRGDRKG